MKKVGILAFWLVFALLFTGCAGKQPFNLAETGDALLKSAAFSEELEEVDTSMVMAYLDLDPDKVKDAVMYGSTGATAEEFILLEMVDESAAQEAEGLLEQHLDYLKESNVDYRPAEMPKIEKAVSERRGTTLALVVAADAEEAQKVLK